MRDRITALNEAIAVWLTKGFGTMWVCYAFMIYGVLPLIALIRPYQDSFLYWSNWVQLWSLPLIMVGTNILGRDAESRARIDHDRLAQSYEEQQRLYREVLHLLKAQEALMRDMRHQDRVLDEQTEMLKRADTQLLHREGGETP